MYLARFLRHSSGESACETMAARRVVLLTPPESSHPIQLPSCQHPVRASALFATLTNRPQIAENSNTLSPAFATHTDITPVTSLFATHTTTTGVYINNSHSDLPRGSSKGSPSLPRGSRGAAAKGARFCPSRFLCNLGNSALNSVFSPSSFNFQLSTSCPSRDLSSQPLTNCPPHNLFLLTSLQMPGGIEGRVQEFLKHYFNCGTISRRLNHLQRDFASHESPVTNRQSCPS